jgi:hypothetical protein
MVRQGMTSRTAIGLLILAGFQIGIDGCYYPAKTQPPPPAKTQAVVKVPYDLTWDAIKNVVDKNEYKILGDDPNHGIVEVESHSFTLSDADCGQMKSIANRYDAEPDPGGSAVYNFKVEPAGPESTSLTVNATYTTPLHVPFHPISDFQCVSRGTQEARLLKEVETAAHLEHRPSAASSTFENAHGLTAGRPTLLRPDFLKKPVTPVK